MARQPAAFWPAAAATLLIAASVLHTAMCEESGPVIIEEPSNREDFSNTTGKNLHCVVRGRPQPSMVWVRAEGGTVIGDVTGLRKVLSNGTLMFPPFRAEDYRQDVHAQVYRCVATNSHGTVNSRDVHVRAVVFQDFRTNVLEVSVIRGNNAILKCNIPSFVADFVKVQAWVDDQGKNYLPDNKNHDGKYLVLPSGELHIKNVNKEDGDKSYQCRTVHKLTGDTRLSATAGRLVISDPIGMSAPKTPVDDLTHSTAPDRGDTTLLCPAQAFPTPDYRWFKFGELTGRKSPVELNDRIKQVGGTLIIKQAKVDDSGKYLCVVNNSVGGESVETVLTVTAPLSAVVEPKVQTVEFGRPATFTCNYKGNPVKSVSWFKDGKKLGHTDAVFRIQAVSREDKGMYQCFIRNDQESAQGTAELKLGGRFEPPQLTYTFSEATLQPNPPVYLKCVAGGNPTPEITWELDGTRLSNSERIQVGQYVTHNGEVVSHLNISGVLTNDGGLYACVASSTVGSVKHAARLNVYGLPYIRPMDKVAVLAGKNMVVHCPVAGYPIDSIVWEKNGRLLPINRRQKAFPNGTLIVEEVQRSADQGRYTCVARNSQGYTARGDLDVQVMVAPRIIPFTFEENIMEGSLVQVFCAVGKGDSPINIRWMLNGEEMHPSFGIFTQMVGKRTSILSIDSVMLVHSGTYTCLASNKAGTSNHTASLLVNVPDSGLGRV